MITISKVNISVVIKISISVLYHVVYFTILIVFYATPVTYNISLTCCQSDIVRR